MSVDNRRHKTSWHWSCASRYCKASWKTEGEYYTLTKVASASKPVVEAYFFVLGKTINEVNFKRQVICTQHWPKGVRKNLEDPPSIKCTNVQGKETKEGREHWNCAAALCTNSWRTKLEGLQYYRLSDFAQCKDKQHAYYKVLMNKAVDFKRDFICSVHWSKGFRDNLDDLPDRACHPDYVNKQTTKKVTPQSKIAAAKRSLSTTKQTNTKRRKLIRSSCSLDFNSEESKFDIMQKELQELKEKLENKTEEANRLSQQVKDLTEKNDSLSKQITQFKGKMKDLTFSYECLKLRPKRFFYMSGLTVDDFNCVLECIEPYISVIIYPDCKTNQDGQRKLTKRTELLCYFTICRHTLHLGVMAFLTNTSDSTISRIFSAWSIFLSTLFYSIDLSPYPGEVISLLPKEFWSSGFQDTVLLGDCTENWISSPENYDVSSATFSNYKNHDTGKTGIWMTPYGGLVMCTDTCPGGITDNELTEQCGVLDMVKEKGTTVLTDKGFGIEDLCHSKGLLHNRPQMKMNPQYDESEISKNFDVATLRIYNENFIGRMRDWSILNACWPKNRCDLLGCTYKVFAHIVNMLFDPIAPKEKVSSTTTTTSSFFI